MAFAASVTWEVQTGGVDGNSGNGGGFDPVSGTPGTDLSQGSPITFTDLVINGVTNTNCTSATRPFTSADVGNIIAISSGTGFTVQRVQIMSVAGAVATCDKSLGTLSSTGGNGKMGGPLATPGQAGALMVGGNDLHIKSGTYTVTSASTNIASGCLSLPAGTITNATRAFGYQTTRGDGGTKPIIKSDGVITAFTLITVGAATYVDNIEADGNSRTTSKGFSISSISAVVYRCRARNCTNTGFLGTISAAFIMCEATACTTQPAFDTGHWYGCNAHDNTSSSTGFSTGTSSIAVDCISANNAGEGFLLTSNNCTMINCTAYGNTGQGFRSTSNATTVHNVLINCISVNSGAFGYQDTLAAFDGVWMFNCAGYNNTSGNIGGNITAANSIGFLTLTAAPFVAAGSNNFGLNSTAGGGATCKAAGLLGVAPGLSTTSYKDLGAAQSQATSGTNPPQIIGA